jgi:copper chaperone CopZ
VQQLVFAVKGMHCGGCENAVRVALSRLHGVRHARPDFRAQQVTVAFDPAKTDAASIRERIQEAGYQVTT